MVIPKQEVIDQLRHVIKDFERDGDDFVNVQLDAITGKPIYANIGLVSANHYDMQLKFAVNTRKK